MTARVTHPSILNTRMVTYRVSPGMVGLGWRLTGWSEDKHFPPVLKAIVFVTGVNRRGSEQAAQCAEDVEERGHDLNRDHVRVDHLRACARS